jgi:quercetin dioxygenase-like cupin family protein
MNDKPNTNSQTCLGVQFLHKNKKRFMEIKRNDATLLRPEGDRVLDAPYVFMDFDSFVKQLKDEEAWAKRDRNGITIFKTDGLTTVLTCLHKDACIEENSVDGLFQVQVLDGKIRVSTDDGDADMREGEMIVFHPNVKHRIEALKKSTLLLQSINERNGNE